MASSSSVPPKEARLHEVFISFRGEDTRHNFVTHLYSALVDKGIITYLDKSNLKQGQTIGDELLKAIEESKIAIVVLSENYGSSTWCLKELVKIMECKFNSGLVVFPVFYHVDPSDVRKQKNNFRLRKDDAETVKWEIALNQVAGLVGEDIRAGKDELSCIKDIVGEILKQLPLKVSQFRKSMVGIESRISEIKMLMFNKRNEVLFIGLWGMGGIGKTTIAKALFADCKNEFGGSCFLANVRQSNNQLERLQERLLSDVLKINDYGTISHVDEGSSIIQQRLCSRKVLCVIDDVDDINQLNALAKECDWFGKGSMIIITTRDDHLIDDGYVKKYDVQRLPENEGLRLFSLQAFKTDHPPEDFKDLSLQVVKYADGLPLALVVLGDHLNRRTMSFWNGTLSRLADIHEDKIISQLRISFDGLNDVEQNIFLNIACFFRGAMKGKVKLRLGGLGLHHEEGIPVLVSKSLIYFVEDDEFANKDHGVEMHDLIQEMGWYIVQQRANKDVNRYNRLWRWKDIVKVLSDTTASSEVEGISVALSEHRFRGDRLGLEAAFRKMNKLTYLELYGNWLGGSCDFIIPLSSGELYNYNLRFFSLSCYRGQSLPEGFRPKNLAHLYLMDSCIKETPDFSHMPNLEVLDLTWSRLLVDVHPSLGDHKKIKRVILKCCEKLEKFPQINQMISLEILDLDNTNLKRFPDLHGNLDSLRKLNVRGTSMNGLPTSMVGNATGLQELDFRCGRPYNEQFTSLEVVEKSFSGLVRLSIAGSGIVRTMDFGQLPHLQSLYLDDSGELKEVHASLGFHKTIRNISLANCSKLVEFPTITDMISLRYLKLDSTGLKSYPEMAESGNDLKMLILDKTRITNLPWSIGCATRLRSICMKWCKKLLTLPISLLALDHLEEVTISHAALKYFTDETGQAIELHSRRRTRQKQLMVSEGMGQLSALGIYFECCRSLEELPVSLLARIVSLTIKECPSLTSWICSNLVYLLDNYQHLCELRLHQRYEIYPDVFMKAFSKWESVSNMLRNREKSFKLYVPGIQIPSWFQYRINTHSATAFLPPLDELYNVKGLVLSGITTAVPTNGLCMLPIFITYVPIDNIIDWEGQNEFTMFEETPLQCFTIAIREISRWELSLVYREDDDRPCDVQIEEDDRAYSGKSQFRVKFGKAKS